MTTAAPHILVVDDDRDIRESLQDALEDHGYAVTCAADGLDALHQLRAAADLPDLVLLDLMMPRMNGTELRAEMLRDARLMGIRVLVVTADADARAKAESMRVDGYLVKPISLRDLFARVTTLLT